MESLVQQTVHPKSNAIFVERSSWISFMDFGTGYLETLVCTKSSNHVKTLRMESINNPRYYFQPREKFSLVGQYTISIVYYKDVEKFIVQVTDIAGEVTVTINFEYYFMNTTEK